MWLCVCMWLCVYMLVCMRVGVWQSICRGHSEVWKLLVFCCIRMTDDRQLFSLFLEEISRSIRHRIKRSSWCLESFENGSQSCSNRKLIFISLIYGVKSFWTMIIFSEQTQNSIISRNSVFICVLVVALGSKEPVVDYFYCCHLLRCLLRLIWDGILDAPFFVVEDLFLLVENNLYKIVEFIGWKINISSLLEDYFH